MCLSIPGKIIELSGQEALVDFKGVCRTVNTSFIRNVAIGDYVLVHAGFAIRKWTAQDVAEYNAIIEEIRKIGY